MEEPEKEGKSNLGLIGWLLFAAGIMLMVVSLGYFFIFGPIFLASFIIAIILMTRKQVGSGIALLLLTLILPPLLGLGLFATRFSQAMKDVEVQKKNKMESIVFEDVRVHGESGFMYCEGKVRNNGTEAVDFIKVKVEWLGADDRMLDTDYTYAVGGESLEPREAKSFKVMTQRDRGMKSARYYIVE